MKQTVNIEAELEEIFFEIDPTFEKLSEEDRQSIKIMMKNFLKRYDSEDCACGGIQPLWLKHTKYECTNEDIGILKA